MSRLDVLVLTDRGERINVEIQVVYQHDMPERMLTERGCFRPLFRKENRIPFFHRQL
ncbi:hypothetical protein HNQ34_000004 [Anoxybacillus tepidamans]|jgi:hypothetical protein|uniref:Uncharacterized protein n=1 Tax=Anoxybacteroides tepidamans TaxID=265948 RepID=A0A7W8INF6_9BACL|nr:Rpn family recombination-promoting nuclease/putative transposase [Anoxybacillus tepidamans]MBB5322927.1 hypothetical protein [Anoxybacillus tepidamans]